MLAGLLRLRHGAAVSLASFIVVHALFLLIAILVAPVFKSER